MEQIKRQKLKNPSIFVSTTRLCVRNIPIQVKDKDLKKVFLKAVNDKSAVITEVNESVTFNIIMSFHANLSLRAE